MANSRRHYIQSYDEHRGGHVQLVYLCGNSQERSKTFVSRLKEYSGRVKFGRHICKLCYYVANADQRKELEDGAYEDSIKAARDYVRRRDKAAEQHDGGKQDHSAQNRLRQLADMTYDPSRADGRREGHEELLERIVNAHPEGVTKGDLYTVYVARLESLPETYDTRPYTKRHLIDILDGMEGEGRVFGRQVSYGRYGRTTVYAPERSALNELPAMRPPKAK